MYPNGISDLSGLSVCCNLQQREHNLLIIGNRHRKPLVDHSNLLIAGDNGPEPWSTPRHVEETYTSTLRPTPISSRNTSSWLTTTSAPRNAFNTWVSWWMAGRSRLFVGSSRRRRSGA